MTSRNPQDWNEYQYGTSHRGSVSSTGGRSVRFDEQDPESNIDGSRERAESGQDLRRRRSSIALRFNSLAQVGGVNSIENFARSWTRAAGFQEINPRRPSFVLHDADRDEDDIVNYGRSDYESGRMPRTSLLRAHLEASSSPENAIDDDSLLPEDDAITPMPFRHQEADHKQLGADIPSMPGSRRKDSIFAISPHLTTPLVGSYGTSYGTLRSNEASMSHAGQLWRQQQSPELTIDGEHKPLLVKEVEQDGKVVLVVVGESTLPQTIFNSTNVLIGVGLLSLPLGIKYAGWVCGLIFLTMSALVTAYTAKLLAKCMDVDASLITFGDLALVSYGHRASAVVRALFTLELLGGCVALTVLFADTMHLLIPDLGINQWKFLCGLILVPLNFIPLRMLSFSSILGVLSCFGIVLIIFIDGFIKPDTPGSLREPAATYLWPRTWATLPLSFGLLISPWGGHSVFPNIYRDMRHPQKYGRAVNITFTFTFTLDCATAIAGLLMFGDGVRDEITVNILNITGYPQIFSIALPVMIGVISLTKLPLAARPIVAEIETYLGLNRASLAETPALTGLASYTRGMLKIAVRVVAIASFVIISILFPAFDSIMAFMGSSLCITICVILPLLFYVKIFGKEISLRERVLDWFLIVSCSIMAAIGTVWAFLPKKMIGAE